MTHNLTVTVLRGGPSAERPISLVSGAAVAAACQRLGYQVIEADIGPDDLSALDLPVDVIFPVLHGSFGEDGQLQAILEERGLRYVGSDAAASRLAMDKDAAKRAWRQAGLPTAPWVVADQDTNPSTIAAVVEPPAVVKPIAEGSSVGVQICRTCDDLQETVCKATKSHGKVLIEQRLFGPELTIGILDETALPVIQVKPADGFYDFEAKYNRDDTSYLLTPEIDRQTYAQVQEIALRAFHVLGCRDYSRVDIIVDSKTGPQLLEINTIPGFTTHSLLPKAAQEIGIDFDQLVDRLVQMALHRA